VHAVDPHALVVPVGEAVLLESAVLGLPLERRRCGDARGKSVKMKRARSAGRPPAGLGLDGGDVLK
jgi:hypothetical protein